MSCRGKKSMALALVLMMALEGCSSGTGSPVTDQAGQEVSENSGAENNSSGNINTASIREEEMFSDRDKEIGYDDSRAVHIALKDQQTESDSNLVEIEGNTVTIKEEGTYLLSGTLSNGQVVVDAENTDKIQLVLKGVNINCDTSAALYVKQADKVFLTLDSGTKNSLSNKEDFVAVDDNNVDGVIFSKDDLTVNGEGTLTIQAAYGHGIVSKDDLVFTGGNYQIQAAKQAVSGKESVRIASGTFQLKAGKDGIHAEDDEDETLGFVYIAGGDITIEDSYEGIEGRKIDITGGNITLKASDDGLNAAGGNDSSGMMRNPMEADENCYIHISGGIVNIDAEGDGIDSNGSLLISGGEIYVSGPTNSGNGALDYGSEASITGGILVAAGAGGMEQNFDSSSTQGSMLVNSSAMQTGAIVLKDSSGKEILSYTPKKAYGSAVISTPEVKKGETYEVALGEETVSVEMTENIYGTGSGMGHGGHGMGGHNGNPDGQFPGGGKRPDGERKERPAESSII